MNEFIITEQQIQKLRAGLLQPATFVIPGYFFPLAISLAST